MTINSKPVNPNHPIMRAWNEYKNSEDFANTKLWAIEREHTEGSLWAAFIQGWIAAINYASELRSDVNPASDQERLNGDPGAGAMGAIIEYRDLIRKTLS